MRHLLITILMALAASPCHACYNDYQCGYEERCVRPAGSMGAGQCIGYSDVFTAPNRGISPHTVGACMSSMDCGIGETCTRAEGSFHGICTK